MRKLIVVTTLLAFSAGLIVGWNLFPQPTWLYNAYGHYILSYFN